MSTGIHVHRTPLGSNPNGEIYEKVNVRDFSGADNLGSGASGGSVNVPRGIKNNHFRRFIPPGAYRTRVDLVDQTSVEFVRDGFTQHAVVNPSYSVDFDPYYDVSKEYRLISKLRAKAYGSGFNPAIFLAEAPQAFRMIANAAYRLSYALSAFRLRNASRLALALGIAVPSDFFKRGRKSSPSQAWLELQYGWLPLFQDAELGAKWLAEMLSGQPKARLVGRATWHTSGVLPIVPNGVSFTQYETTWRLQIIAYIQRSSQREQYMPSLVDLATVAWEKLPWSFAYDWFIPVGAYLDACRTAHDLDGTFVRSLKRDTRFFSPVFDDPFGGTFVKYHGAPFRRNIDFTREVTSEIQVPNPISKVSELLDYKSWRHAANAVALLLQRSTAPRL